MKQCPVCRRGYQERQIENHGIPKVESNVWDPLTWPLAEYKPIPQAQPDVHQKAEMAGEPCVECLLETVMISCATILADSGSYKLRLGMSVQIP